jgi:hypothetical protein
MANQPPQQRPAPPPQRRRSRVFMWVILTINVLFLVWLVSALVVRR